MSAGSPLVSRPVRTGGLFLAIGAAQFLAVLLWVQSLDPVFNVRTTSLATLRGAPGPWGVLFDGSVVALGALALAGLLLAWSAFDARPGRGLGLLLLVLSAGSVLAAGVLELARRVVPTAAPVLAAELAVVAAGIGLVVVSSAMHQHGRWRVSSAYTFVSGLAMLGAVTLAALPVRLAPGTGLLSSVAIGAAVLWALVEGLHLAVLHRFAPGLTVRPAAG